MGFSSVYGWRLPDGPLGANGPKAFSELAGDIEGTLSGVRMQSYTPTWSSDGSQQPSNPASRIGRYQLSNGWCDFSIYISFSSTSSGGKGRLSLGLPAPASSQLAEQVVRAKLWHGTTGLIVDGIGLIAAGASAVRPMWTVSQSNSNIDFWLNNNDGNQPGTGIPQIPSHWTVEPGGNVVVSGRYLVA